jgi:Peptidase U49
MKGLAVGLITFFWGLPVAIAADISSLYDRSSLEYWGERYKRSTNKILDELIWPALLSKEQHNLGSRPVLDFPLYAEGSARQHPLNFYALPNRNTIIFPVFSLKFLDDLCTAYAWLQVKGYGLETVSEYTAILFFGNPPPGGFPQPLKALGIPEDALKDPKVDELALGHFVTARTFILLHEMGHLLYDHNATSSDESIRNEQQADRFAGEVMQRTPLPPLGMLIWFLADAHWTGFPPQRGTHPLSGERVVALADHIENPGLANELRRLGKEFLDDPDIRAGFVATGKAGDLAALAPRRPGQLPRRKHESKPGASGALFSGVYRGEFVQFGEAPDPMAIELILERRGDQITGRYSFGLGLGAIREGRVVENRLYFDWEWAGNYGQGVLEERDDGSFTGTWGYREARSGAGTWTGCPSKSK